MQPKKKKNPRTFFFGVKDDIYKKPAKQLHQEQDTSC